MQAVLDQGRAHTAHVNLVQWSNLQFDLLLGASCPMLMEPQLLTQWGRDACSSMKNRELGTRLREAAHSGPRSKGHAASLALNAFIEEKNLSSAASKV